MDYSIENIKRLWDAFSVRLRERIAKGLLDENDIVTTKTFDEQSNNGREDIIAKFKHGGINVYSAWHLEDVNTSNYVNSYIAENS